MPCALHLKVRVPPLLLGAPGKYHRHFVGLTGCVIEAGVVMEAHVTHAQPAEGYRARGVGAAGGRGGRHTEDTMMALGQAPLSDRQHLETAPRHAAQGSLRTVCLPAYIVGPPVKAAGEGLRTARTRRAICCQNSDRIALSTECREVRLPPSRDSQRKYINTLLISRVFGVAVAAWGAMNVGQFGCAPSSE